METMQEYMWDLTRRKAKAREHLREIRQGLQEDVEFLKDDMQLHKWSKDSWNWHPRSSEYFKDIQHDLLLLKILREFLELPDITDMRDELNNVKVAFYINTFSPDIFGDPIPRSEMSPEPRCYIPRYK